MSHEPNDGLQADILIVDDEPESLRLLIEILDKQGYRVRPSTDGHQALAAVRLEPPDLILLDVMMPVMSGYEICEQLKANEISADIPVIFISALTQVFDKVKAFSLGVVDYIIKPFQAEEVLARLKTHLAISELQKELEQRNLKLQQEISRRQQVEEKLRESEQRYRAVVEDQTEVISRLRADGTFVFVNDVYCRFFGKSEEELLEKKWQPVAVPEDIPTVEARLSTMSPANPTVIIENRVYSGNGTLRWMQFVNRGFFDAQGQLVEIQSVGRDITALKEAELKIQEINQALQQRVSELTVLDLISQTINTVTDFRSALEIVAGTVTHLFDASGTSIALIGPAFEEIEVAASFEQHLPGSGPKPEATGKLSGLMNISVSAAPLRDYVIEGRPFALSGAEAGEAWPSASALVQAGNIQGLLVVPLQIRGQVIGLLTVATDQPDREFTPDEKSLAETIGGQISGAIETARSFEEEQRQRKLAESLREVTTALSRSLDRQTVLRTIFEKLQRVLPYDGASVWLIDKEELVMAEAVGLSASHLGYRLPLKSDTPLTQVLQERQAVILTDPAKFESWATWFIPSKANSWMGSPLVIGQSTLGLLVIEQDQVGAYRPEDAQNLQSFANQAAIAIENTRLYEQAQTVAVDAERQRLSRELHDSVTQSLYSLTLLTNGWAKMAQQGRLEAQQVAEHFKQLEAVSLQGLKEMRLLLHQLRPPILEEVGLVGALQQRLHTVEQRVNIKTRLLTEGEIDSLPPATAEQLFFIGQEALNNALQHAEATEVVVRIEVEDEQLLLAVTDNGLGFDPCVPSFGLGLESIRQRAESIGGQSEITSATEQGTAVKVTVALGSSERV